MWFLDKFFEMRHKRRDEKQWNAIRRANSRKKRFWNLADERFEKNSAHLGTSVCLLFFEA